MALEGLGVRGPPQRTRALPNSAKKAKKKTSTSAPLRITAVVRETLEMSDDVEECRGVLIGPYSPQRRWVARTA